jgi:hypothetical protein
MPSNLLHFLYELSGATDTGAFQGCILHVAGSSCCSLHMKGERNGEPANTTTDSCLVSDLVEGSSKAIK